MNKMSNEQTFTLEIHEEEGSFWAEVTELPGCFAAGDTLDELQEAAIEAILMVLDDSDSTPDAEVADIRAHRRFKKSPPMPQPYSGFKSAQIAVHA